jgi:arylsulfatase A-like enzyme
MKLLLALPTVIFAVLTIKWMLLSEASSVIFGVVALASAMFYFYRDKSITGRAIQNQPSEKLNVIMIGSDTLRVDRLGAEGYWRRLTPNLDRLADKGAYFASHYVPIARTAPSLISLMSGRWPHATGIRDNFASGQEAKLKLPSLASMLNDAGYNSAVVSDWTGGDFGKFNFGFTFKNLSKDQWNIKYLIRQGPKDIRLFLSLFTHNKIGRRILPEIYYFAGIPLIDSVISDSKKMIDKLVGKQQPFFLNVFIGATHPPFGSPYPYYSMYAPKDYIGESKFCMSRLTDPIEIIRSQQEPREAFDLDQIIDIYDGCVKCFDDAVANILQHIEDLGIKERTLIVVYSDHGMELFENNTWGQGNSVFSDYSSRTPLVIYDPRREPVGKIDKLTRSIDVLPTVLDMLGLAKPNSCDGVSLVPYMQRDAGDMGLHAYTETGIWLAPPPGQDEDHLIYPSLLEILDIPDKSSGTLAIKEDYKNIIVLAKDRMIKKGKWKLIYVPLISGSKYLLFDISVDPLCRKDVSKDYPNAYKELIDLLHWHLSQDDIVPASSQN